MRNHKIKKMYLSVEDIAELFGLSVSFAYRVVERMNADLASKNYYVILGRVPTLWIISFVCLPGGGKNECRSGKQELLCDSSGARHVEDKIYGLKE